MNHKNHLLLMIFLLFLVIHIIKSPLLFAAGTIGTVRFVADLQGNGDVTQLNVRETIYIRVDDSDRNLNPLGIDSVFVKCTTPHGDLENNILLQEIDPNKGIFTGSINSYNHTPSSVSTYNGTLEVYPPEEITTVTYRDLLNPVGPAQDRTDTLTILSPDLEMCKVSDPNITTQEGIVTYTITIKNKGYAKAVMTSLLDVLSSQFTYVHNSTSGFTTNEPQIVAGQTLIWERPSGLLWDIPAHDKISGQDGIIILSFRSKASQIWGTYYNQAQISGDNFDIQNITCPNNQNLVIVKGPLIQLEKSVDKTDALPGEELLYTIYYYNVGPGEAVDAILTDTIPPETNYVPNSLKLGAASSTYATAASVTDQSGDDAGEINGNAVTFKISRIDPDDGNPGGNDEGRLYYKVTVK